MSCCFCFTPLEIDEGEDPDSLDYVCIDCYIPPDCDKCGFSERDCRCSQEIQRFVDGVSDFVQRAKIVCKESAEERYKESYNNKWINKHKDVRRAVIKKYCQTEKGKFATSKRNFQRRVNYKFSCESLTWEEKKLIGKFYKNCPEGYEVDHIIPISKGGLHQLSNLQYLTKEENRKKSAKLDWKKEI